MVILSLHVHYNELALQGTIQGTTCITRYYLVLSKIPHDNYIACITFTFLFHMLRFVLTLTLCSSSFLTRKYKFIYTLEKFVVRYFFDLVFYKLKG